MIPSLGRHHSCASSCSPPFLLCPTPNPSLTLDCCVGFHYFSCFIQGCTISPLRCWYYSCCVLSVNWFPSRHQALSAIFAASSCVACKGPPVVLLLARWRQGRGGTTNNERRVRRIVSFCDGNPQKVTFDYHQPKTCTQIS